MFASPCYHTPLEYTGLRVLTKYDRNSVDCMSKTDTCLTSKVTPFQFPGVLMISGNLEVFVAQVRSVKAVSRAVSALVVASNQSVAET